MKKKANNLSPRTGTKPSADPQRNAEKSSRQESWFSSAAMREVVESVVVAFVLAFLFRTFDAEAFVIPTGSMAPTLMGRHKEVTCPKCGYRFQVSASAEMDAKTNQRKEVDIVSGTCPICHYPVDLTRTDGRPEEVPSFKGDRILVAKFPYQFHPPQRWDVAVFMYPGEAKVNYIKRVVGLPDETILISHGDIFVKPAGKDGFEIARKPPDKILATMQVVDDNDYLAPELPAAGWPAAWSPEAPSDGGGAWQTADGKSFSTDGSAGAETWLNYQHFVPTSNEWLEIVNGQPLPSAPRPELITDFVPYDTGVDSTRVRDSLASVGARLPRGFGVPASPERNGLHWVGDLIVEFTLKVESASGQVAADLVRGGRHFQCAFDLATGQATLKGLPGVEPTAMTAVRGPGEYQIRFANVNDQLVLWVRNDRLLAIDSVVAFDAPTTYDSRKLGIRRPRADDLKPVRIASHGAVVRVSHLRLFRDLYYIAVQYGQDGGYGGPLTDWKTSVGPLSEDFFSDPRRWGVFDQLREVAFTLKKDQFFMLGDNGAESKDSRLWESQCFVDRDLLKGKAVYIYWPHSWDRTPPLPLFSKGIPFPFFPNFGRMGFVR